MSMTNQDILDEIAMVRNHGEQSKSIYKTAIEHYCNFHQMTIQELIDEADEEEEAGIRWKKRKLKKRLLTFRQWLIQQQYKKATIKSYFTAVKVIYKYFEIEIGEMPQLNNKSVNLPEPIGFKDILTHEEINLVLQNTNKKFNALILFMCSSGCARAETLSLSIQQFIDATVSYHGKTDILEALHTLQGMNDVVPTFYLKRIKTNKYYYTFCSPEAVKSIVNYLLNDRLKYSENGELITKPSEQLFKIKASYLPAALWELNKELNLGRAGSYQRLRTHMFRKFNASILKKAGMSESDIDEIQGRGKSSTRAAYFYEDPETLRKKYIDCLPALAINDNVNVLDFKAPEYRRLEEEVKEKNDLVNNMEERLSNVEEIFNQVNSLSDDEILGLFAKKKQGD